MPHTSLPCSSMKKKGGVKADMAIAPFFHPSLLAKTHAKIEEEIGSASANPPPSRLTSEYALPIR